MGELYTQDLDVPGQPPHDNPEPKPGAPGAVPRDDRVSKEEVAALVARWKAINSMSGTFEGWVDYVGQNTGRGFNVKAPDAWTREDARSIDNALKLEEGG